MRPIKFRVWDAENKQMYFSHGQYGQDFCFGRIGNGIYKDGFLVCDITKENIMQFTGLKDIKNQDIYEGDIIKDQGEVVFGKIGYDGSWNGLTGFGFKSDMTEEGFLELRYHMEPDQLEIIGNIHETPTLLKSEE